MGNGLRGEYNRNQRGEIMLKIFEGAKFERVGKDTLDIVRRNGTDVSYDTEDQHIEAYLFAGHVYVASVQPAGPRE